MDFLVASSIYNMEQISKLIKKHKAINVILFLTTLNIYFMSHKTDKIEQRLSLLEKKIVSDIKKESEDKEQKGE